MAQDYYQYGLVSKRDEMSRMYWSILLESVAFLVFALLCSPAVSVPLSFLLVYLFILQVGLIWMVISILKDGKTSTQTFDQRFYEDADLGPRS